MNIEIRWGRIRYFQLVFRLWEVYELTQRVGVDREGDTRIVLETQCPLATTPNISLHFAKESGIVQVHWLKPYLLRKVLRWAYKPKGLMTLSHGHVLTTSNPSSKGNSLSLALIYLIRWSRSLLTWEPFCFLSHDFEYLSLGYILIFQCKSNFIHI